jgi:hypothetical protein
LNLVLLYFRFSYAHYVFDKMLQWVVIDFGGAYKHNYYSSQWWEIELLVTGCDESHTQQWTKERGMSPLRWWWFMLALYLYLLFYVLFFQLSGLGLSFFWLNLFVMVFQQDRTGRIMFKLFDKHPSHFPGTLRSQVKLLLHFPINFCQMYDVILLNVTKCHLPDANTR